MAKPSLVIALGIGKKKPIGQEGPPPSRYRKAIESPTELPHAESSTDPVAEETAEGDPLGGGADDVGLNDTSGGGIGPADVDYSDNDLCESCLHMSDAGDCNKYGFPVEPTGHCEAGYEPKESVVTTPEGGTPKSTGT